MKRKVLKFLVFSWRRNLQNEIKENVFFWNGKKNLLNCFQTVKTSEKEENQKMNLVKIFSCMKPKENVFNPENIFFFVHSVSYMSLKNNVRNKTKTIYWVFYIQENLKQSEKKEIQRETRWKNVFEEFLFL